MDIIQDAVDQSEYEIVGDVAGLTDVTQYIDMIHKKIKEPIDISSLYQKLVDYVREL